MADSALIVRCTFAERAQVTDAPTYSYTTIKVRTFEVFSLPITHPPSVGDLVHLDGGTYRVLERAWTYPQYGSADWPDGYSRPQAGPLLDVIVEAAQGPYINEAD